jgi:hypothetical protein
MHENPEFLSSDKTKLPDQPNAAEVAPSYNALFKFGYS